MADQFVFKFDAPRPHSCTRPKEEQWEFDLPLDPSPDTKRRARELLRRVAMPQPDDEALEGLIVAVDAIEEEMEP